MDWSRRTPEGVKDEKSATNIEINKEIVRLHEREGSAEQILVLCDLRMADFNTVNYATAVHRLAKLRSADSSLSLDRRFQRLLSVLKEPRALRHFLPRELSMLAWSLVTLDVAETEDVLQKLGAELTRRKHLKAITPQTISNLAWSFVKAQVRDLEGSFCLERLLCCLGKEAILMGLAGFRPQELANMAWAYATAGYFVKETLVVLIAQELVSRDLSTFEAQHLPSMAWSLILLGKEKAATGVASVCKECLRRGAAHFRTEHLISFAVSCARAPGLNEDDLMQFLEAEVLQRGLHDQKERALASLAWSFARYWAEEREGGSRSPPLRFMQQLADELGGRRLEDFSSHQLALLAWSFAVVGYPPENPLAPRAREFLLRVAGVMRPRDLRDGDPVDLCNIAWALATTCSREDEDVRSFLERAREQIEKRRPAPTSKDRNGRLSALPSAIGERYGVAEAGHDLQWAAPFLQLVGSAWAEPVAQPEGLPSSAEQRFQ